MVTILKLNNNLHSGSVQTSHGRKKHVKVGAMSSQCWLFFSIVRVLCTTNLLQEVRRSTQNITLKFWKKCVMSWEENDCACGQPVTGFFTTITRQSFHRTLCNNFWRNTRLYGRPSFLQVTTLHSHNSTHTTRHDTILYGHNSTSHNSTRPQLDTAQLDTSQFDTSQLDTTQLYTTQLYTTQLYTTQLDTTTTRHTTTLHGHNSTRQNCTQTTWP